MSRPFKVFLQVLIVGAYFVASFWIVFMLFFFSFKISVHGDGMDNIFVASIIFSSISSVYVYVKLSKKLLNDTK